MCKKQTSVSHSSTEAEVISLDAGLRMDGIATLTLWDLVIEVFHSVPDKTDGPKREPWRNPSAVVKPKMHNSIPIKQTNVIPTNIDYNPIHSAHAASSAMLYVFEAFGIPALDLWNMVVDVFHYHHNPANKTEDSFALHHVNQCASECKISVQCYVARV